MSNKKITPKQPKIINQTKNKIRIVNNKRIIAFGQKLEFKVKHNTINWICETVFLTIDCIK